MIFCSHGIIIHGDTIFISSVAGLNKKGELVCGGVKEQAVKILDNLKCILESVGATLMSVVKTRIKLTNIEDTEDIHQIYSTCKALLTDDITYSLKMPFACNERAWEGN